MAGRFVFVLNLDADLEIGERSYTPTESVRRAVRANATPLIGTLVRERDAVADESSPEGSFAGFVGRAFAPTPRALATLRRVGATLPDAPDASVLANVMRRDFAYLEELPASLVTDDAEAVLEHLRSPPPIGDGYRIKRVRGMTGRGHRVVRGLPSESDLAFVRARTEGFVIEPNVTIVCELALHGFLTPDGRLVRGRLCRSIVDPRGVWKGTVPHDDPSRAHALERSLEDAARALVDAGYFGPFGIDAYVYDRGGAYALRTRGETNARYSMGWAIGMADVEPRPDRA